MNILITGGASGLGEAITRELAANEKNNIFFTFNKSLEKAQKIDADLKNAKSIKCNFENGTEMQSLIDRMQELDLDVLINNAYNGEFLKTHFHKSASEDFLSDFKKNLIPTIEITQSAIVSFRKKKRGKIITILTAALANVPPIGSSIYIANKAYLEKLTKVWASENIKFNITSNSISPAFMRTNLTSSFDERIITQMTENHPLKKTLTVEEVAETVLFLTSASSHINGIDIMINAGIDIK